MPRSGDAIYQRGDTWWLDFIHRGTRHKVRIGRKISRTDAKVIAQRERGKILGGEAGIGKKRKDIGFKEARERFENWLEVNRKPLTVKSYKECLSRLAKKFEGKRLGEISTADLERYKESRVRGERGKMSANGELRVLRSMVNCCGDWGLFEGTNPVVKVKRFKERKGRERFLREEEEEAKLLEAAAEPLRTIILCGTNAGLRIAAEALTLRWAALDLPRGILTVEGAYSKNHETETVPMTERLKAALLKQRFTSGKRDPEEHVFMNRRGKPFRSIRNVFEAARDAAGLGKDVTPHVCRHTFASRLVMEGVDMRTVQRLMRHKSILMTMRYAHLSPEHEREAIARLDAPKNSPPLSPPADACPEAANAINS